MTSEELKKKIKEILRKRMTELLGSCHTDEIPLTEEGAEAILFYADEFADALIAAGLRFGENLTATFDHMALEREHKLERRLSDVEYWKSVYDRALNIAFTGEERAYFCKKAEAELKVENEE